MEDAKVELIHRAKSMGLAHCPLCVGLAILSVVRCSACGLMLWQWIRPQRRLPRLASAAVGAAPLQLTPAL